MEDVSEAELQIWSFGVQDSTNAQFEREMVLDERID